ncbi:hypothetical protein [Brevibacterium litoralis]|uniref:hypothetical protein n=1 Tax=Brevibacterium litoralis TaxID=3138935 RepID=UPI0032EE1427
MSQTPALRFTPEQWAEMEREAARDAAELAAAPAESFTAYQPDDPSTPIDLALASQRIRAAAWRDEWKKQEKVLLAKEKEIVRRARAERMSWDAIGQRLGFNGETMRKRYPDL